MRVITHAIDRFRDRVPGAHNFRDCDIVNVILQNITPEKYIATDERGGSWYRGQVKLKTDSQGKRVFAICVDKDRDIVVTIYGVGMAILQDLVVGSNEYYIPYSQLEEYRRLKDGTAYFDYLIQEISKKDTQISELKQELKDASGRIHPLDIWSAPEIAYLMRKSERTIERMFKTGKIKGIQKGRVWLAHKNEVLELIRSER